MQRVCFLLRVRPDRMEEYARRHESVWPQMRQALQDSGWHNYSLFVAGDGLLVGYLETDDFEAAQARMARLEVNQRWQAQMADFFEGLETGAADSDMKPLTEVFHLD